MNEIDRVWPNDSIGKVPYRGYFDPEVYGADCGCRQTEIVLSAICHDVLVPNDARIRLRERIVVFNSEMIPNSLIYPA